MAESIEVALVVNRRPLRLRVGSNQRLIDVLRDDLRLTGAKECCSSGDCGSCTVLLDGQAVNSCLVMAYQADGGSVETIEGLGTGPLHPLQEAFVEKGAVHCGMCTPGVILSGKALLDSNPSPSLEEIRLAIAGNLCRCTGYSRMVGAIARAAGSAPTARQMARSQGLAPSYFRPRSLDEALEILAQRSGEARPIAGGTSALVRAAGGSVDRGTLFDVTAVPEMQGIEERSGHLWLGSAATYAQVSSSALAGKWAPVLYAACGAGGSAQVRNRATLGGSVASRLPFVDSLPALMVADALLEVLSVSSRREIPIGDFLDGASHASIAPDELIVGIVIPKRDGVRGAFARLPSRRGARPAKVSVATQMTFKGGGPDWVRVAVGAASERVTRAPMTERALERGSYDALLQAMEAIRNEAAAADDERSTAAYRGEMVALLLEQTVRQLTEA